MSHESKYEAELAEAANHLQKIHPMGHCMGIGLLCVAQAVQEVGEDLAALKAQLREAHAILEECMPNELMPMPEWRTLYNRRSEWLFRNADIVRELGEQ